MGTCSTIPRPAGLPSVANTARQRTTRGSRRGAAVVETAIVLPVFVMIVLGTIEACSMIFLQQTLEIAAYEGVRTALVKSANLGNVQGACQQVITNRNLHGAVITVTPSNFDQQPLGTFIRVSVTVPCNQNCLFPSWFYGGRSLTGAAEMMKEY